MPIWIMDAGNTRLKLREVENERVLRSIILTWEKVDDAFIKSICGSLAIVTKVITRDALTNLLKQFQEVVIVDHKLIEKEFNFKTNYIEPTQLGVDRLIASLGAHLSYPSQEKIAVINAGTATTVELIENNIHIGGMIIAGNQLMLNALAGADQLPKLNVDFSANIGVTSAQCMQTGLAFMNQGLVLAIVKAYKIDKILICGGHNKQFENLHNNITLVPDLIMQTLAKLSVKLTIKK